MYFLKFVSGYVSGTKQNLKTRAVSAPKMSCMYVCVLGTPHAWCHTKQGQSAGTLALDV
jgi:hypothetical protein